MKPSELIEAWFEDLKQRATRCPANPDMKESGLSDALQAIKKMESAKESTMRFLRSVLPCRTPLDIEQIQRDARELEKTLMEI